jgi:hypothetical protein
MLDADTEDFDGLEWTELEFLRGMLDALDDNYRDQEDSCVSQGDRVKTTATDRKIGTQ